MEEWIPQATVKKPMTYFQQMGIDFTKANDDLDCFSGSPILRADGESCVLRHYRGHEKGTVTIYFPFSSREWSLAKLDHVLSGIFKRFKIDDKAIVWQRGHEHSEPRAAAAR